MTKYQGTIFGFHYNMEFATDEAFAEWLIAKLAKQLPVATWQLIITKLLRQSPEYNIARSKITEFEARITALEAAP